MFLFSETKKGKHDVEAFHGCFGKLAIPAPRVARWPDLLMEEKGKDTAQSILWHCQCSCKCWLSSAVQTGSSCIWPKLEKLSVFTTQIHVRQAIKWRPYVGRAGKDGIADGLSYTIKVHGDLHIIKHLGRDLLFQFSISSHSQKQRCLVFFNCFLP